MRLKATNHQYYSSENNFFVGDKNGENWGRTEYATWEDFKDSYFGDGTFDYDLNHCFRFDILPKRNREDDTIVEGEFSLWLFYILQRKGVYLPVVVQNIYPEDMLEIEAYLRKCYEYLQNQWQEFSGVGGIL